MFVVDVVVVCLLLLMLIFVMVGKAGREILWWSPHATSGRHSQTIYHFSQTIIEGGDDDIRSSDHQTSKHEDIPLFPL